MPKRRAARARFNLERLEDRLTPSWAGVPPATITPPAAFTAFSLNGQGDATGSASITGGEVDWYRFTAPVGGAHVFQATTPSSDLDTVIAVFSSAGQRLAYNDDISSSNTDSRLSVSLAAGQTYYLAVTNYTGSPPGAYSLLIDGPAQAAADDAYENNDTLATASNLGTLTTVKTISNLVMADGHDCYRFQTAAAGTAASSVSISFQHSLGDLDMELFNASGVRVGTSQGVTNSERISLNGLAAGTYYVHVYGYRGATNPSYSLTVTPPVSTPPPTTGGFHIQLVFGAGLTASQQAVFAQAAARWEQVIVGDIPDATYAGHPVDDIEISASGASIDGAGGVLGQAGPDALRWGTSLPIHGTMQFDTADLASLQSTGQLLSVILHEMGHVLGIGTIWANRGLLSGAGGSNPLFVGAQATAQYNSIFHTHAAGVPVENSGGSGTRDSHWREGVFGAELMTGYLNGGVANPLSRVTVASLADLGYQVNLNAADAYTPAASASALLGSSGGGRTSLQAAEDLASADALPILPPAPAERHDPAPPNASTTDALLRANDALLSSLGGQNLGAMLRALARGRGLSQDWLTAEG
jgi:hypothetical protein